MTPDTLDASLLTKVRKLLAMAEGSANPNEADAFSRKAAELIAAHRIDPERLRAEADDDLSVLEVALGRGAYVRGRLGLLQVIAEAHGCRVVFEVRDRGTVAFAAGFRSDLDTTELLYHSLHMQASSRMAGEKRATGAATQQWRRSFLFGFADEIRQMLQTSAQEAHRHQHPASSALPALRARDRRVNEFVRQRWGRVSAARRPKPATVTGFEAGRRATARGSGSSTRGRLASHRARRMSADIGREAVYAAEIAAFESTSFESLCAFDELLDLAALITGAAWWPHGPIEVVPARADAGSSSTRQRSAGAPVVRLAAPQMTPATVVHEFAHVLAGVSHGHDDVFRRAHVDLTGYMFGDEPASWLLDGYAVMGLEPGVRAWSAPPLRHEAGGPVAL